MDMLEAYLALVEKRPEMFVNPPGAQITILLDKEGIREAEEHMTRVLKEQGLPTLWARVGIAFQDQYLLLLRDAVRFPDGTPGTYSRLVEREHYAPGVVILPVHQQHVLLVRHFRHATRTWHLEVPRGFGTKGLVSEENASSELRDEIGATSFSLTSLGQVHPDTGMLAEKIELFYADVASYSGTRDVREGITGVLPVSVADFEELIRDNRITDGFTLAAYARAKLRGLL
jgi:ADP-ribose pyrophosphatase